MIPKDTIDKIFETARIEEVVGDFVTLKKRGTNLLGLCPFHNEKTPSFNVSPVKGIYKCFGCGKAGNAVNFVMEHEQMSYPEALRYIANKYKIEIEEEERTPEQLQANNDRESILVASSFAQKYFTENLFTTDEGKSIGLSYFKERGFRDNIIEKFQLGYSLDNRKAFSEAALKAGYKLEFLVKAGLTISKEDVVSSELSVAGSPDSEQPTINNQQPTTNNYFDRFSGRVMFPIHNATGRVIAFGGRTLKSDKKIAKYINSPETEIYYKSKVLYGLFQAKKGIVQEDNCFLAEGYTDVISLHQAGIENVVASSGTSLTVEQIRLIKRYTPNITILYDGDAAGIKASFRGIDLILEEGINVSVLLFPDGDDPDSYSKKISNEEFKNFIKKNTQSFVGYKTELLMKEAGSDPFKRTTAIKEIAATLALLNGLEASQYITKFVQNQIIKIDEQTFIFEVNKHRRERLNKKRDQLIPVIPDEKKMLNDSVSSETVLEKELILDIDSSEAQEKEILRLLINYGTKNITIKSTDEENKPIDLTISVAEFIVHELLKDQIIFENPIYQKTFSVFANGVEQSGIPSLQSFIQHSDREISQLTINALSMPYSLHKWDQHNILVQTEELILKVASENSVYALKSKRIEKMLRDNQEKLKTATAEDEIIQLQFYHTQLLNAKKKFNQILGRVVVK